MFIVRNRKIFFALSAILVIGSIVAMFIYGLNFGIDFKGGSILQVSYFQSGTTTQIARPGLESVQERIDELNLGGYSVRPSGEFSYVIRTREVTPEEKETIIEALSVEGIAPEEERFNVVGPVVGNELRNKAYVALAIVLVGILLFVTFAFRKVSKPVSSWKYGLITILALFHDVIIPTGIFIVYAHYFGGEIDLLFVSAILAILGYSVHDTIVVFDRVRENLRVNEEHKIRESFDETVGKSISETFTRSINTSVTTFLVLTTLYLLGGESTKNFSLVLLIGIIVGVYSSIFFASPLLVSLVGSATIKVKK